MNMYVLTVDFISNRLFTSSQSATTMAPLRQTHSIHAQLAGIGNLAGTAALHGGNLPHRYGRFQPYIVRAPALNRTFYEIPDIPLTLLDKIKSTQDAAVNI